MLDPGETSSLTGEMKSRIIPGSILAGTLLFILFIQTADAGSASWTAAPSVFNLWTDVNNWTPATVPNGPDDIATFPATTSLSTLPEINSSIELNSLIFDPGCPDFFTIEIDGLLTMSGAGVINNSGKAKVVYVKPYPAGELDFTGSAVGGDSNCYFTTYQRIMRFFDSSSAGSAFFTAESGVNIGEGGLIEFNDSSTGGTAFISLPRDPRLKGPGILSIYNHQPPGVSIGALDGGGNVLLGAVTGPASGRNLTVGTNDLSTIFSGVIQDAGKGGSLTKVGKGQLVLSGVNLYLGGTLVSDGQLLVTNQTGSATGTGPVKVIRRGALGGFGTIAGAVTVGTGTGSGGKLAPSIGNTQPLVLTIQSLLTFKGGGTYSPRLFTSNATADQVRANGATIESGARFVFAGAGQGSVLPGTVFTVIGNSAATPISGAFSNLADGSTLIVGSNTFQANYEGGDGNDLTLTVLP